MNHSNSATTPKAEQVHLSSSIVFGDLRDTYEQLSAERRSPVMVRRLFSQFIDYSQKLTSTMRRDYKKVTGNDWKASEFEGWNSATEVLKKLRNFDQHENPIQIQVHQRNYYSIDATESQFFVAEGTWSLGDPFSKSPPKELELYMARSPNDSSPEQRIEPVRVEYEFLLYAENPQLEKLLKKLQENNIHAFCEECFSALESYNDFFLQGLKQAEPK